MVVCASFTGDYFTSRRQCMPNTNATVHLIPERMTWVSQLKASGMVQGFAFLGDPYHKALAEQGQAFKGRKNTATDERLSAWKKRHKPRRGECYMNAQRFVMENPDTRYYEGYWWSGCGLVPVHHAWVVIDGEVVDFTAEDVDAYCKRMATEADPADNDYFGIHVPTAFVIKAMLATEMWTDVSASYLNYLGTGVEPAKANKAGKARKKRYGRFVRS